MSGYRETILYYLQLTISLRPVMNVLFDDLNFQCENARTYRECREKGYVETCTKKQNSCFVETLKEKVPRVSFPDYDYHKGRKGDVVRVEINMGCKQPEACYANKKQNFLVRSGRQCFPKVRV